MTVRDEQAASRPPAGPAAEYVQQRAGRAGACARRAPGPRVAGRVPWRGRHARVQVRLRLGRLIAARPTRAPTDRYGANTLSHTRYG